MIFMVKSFIYGLCKIIYGTALSYNLYAVYNESVINSETFFNSFLQNVPAQLLSVIGVLIVCVKFFGTVSDTWKKHELNKSEVKKSKEKVEQESIITDIKEEELKKMKNDVQTKQFQN